MEPPADCVLPLHEVPVDGRLPGRHGQRHLPYQVLPGDERPGGVEVGTIEDGGAAEAHRGAGAHPAALEVGHRTVPHQLHPSADDLRRAVGDEPDGHLQRRTGLHRRLGRVTMNSGACIDVVIGNPLQGQQPM